MTQAKSDKSEQGQEREQAAKGQAAQDLAAGGDVEVDKGDIEAKESEVAAGLQAAQDLATGDETDPTDADVKKAKNDAAIQAQAIQALAVGGEVLHSDAHSPYSTGEFYDAPGGKKISLKAGSQDTEVWEKVFAENTATESWVMRSMRGAYLTPFEVATLNGTPNDVVL